MQKHIKKYPKNMQFIIFNIKTTILIKLFKPKINNIFDISF